MSSHKEAPAIAKDPAADSTDLYAFVSPYLHHTVTILANYVPLQIPDGGPNFSEFGAKTSVAGAAPTGDDVLYEIHVVNDGSGTPAYSFQFTFTTTILDPNTFLYNTGPITVDSNGKYSNTWNRQQTYSVTLVDHRAGTSRQLNARPLTCPPCNVGVRSTPNYDRLSDAAGHDVGGEKTFFAGPRADGFFVDLGSIFDLADLRPLSSHHALAPHRNTPGINSLADTNVQTIAMRVPIAALTKSGKLPTGPGDQNAVLGFYTTASRQMVRTFDPTTGVTSATGAYQQVSRLGSPLVNEVVVPMASKDFWNSQQPVNDSQFKGAVDHPELQKLLPVLYPGVFPNLAKYKQARADLQAIFETGIPGSVIGPAFGVGTYQGSGTIAEMLRLNTAILPTGPNDQGSSNLGLLGGDLAGFPNGRRVSDDVVSIELKAVAGATIPLVDKTYKPDAAVALVSQGVASSGRAIQPQFPHLGNPHGGFTNPVGTPQSNPDPQL